MSTPPDATEPGGRIVAYDALRVFAIATVVLIHTLMPYREVLPDTAPVRVFDDVLHYAVPLFVFISGALLWSRRWTGGAAAYPSFLRRRFVTIGFPFLAWAAIYSALYVWRASDAREAALQVPGLVASGHVWYHLYFIPMLLTFYLLTPVASGALHRSPELTVIAAYAIRVALGPLLARALAEFHPLAGQYATHVLSHLPHMALGGWFALRLAGFPTWLRRSWPLMLAAGFATLVFVSVSPLPRLPIQAQRLPQPTGMALVVLGFALGAIALEPHYARWSRQLTHLGALSFGVYFMHPAVLLAVFGLAGPATPGSAWWSWWFPALVWTGVSAVCFAATHLLGSRRATAWFVGLRRKPRTGTLSPRHL